MDTAFEPQGQSPNNEMLSARKKEKCRSHNHMMIVSVSLKLQNENFGQV
jgi:hypothetical protein